LSKKISEKYNDYGKSVLSQYLNKTRPIRFSSNRNDSKQKFVLNISPIQSKEKIETIDKLKETELKVIKNTNNNVIDSKNLNEKIKKRKEEVEKLMAINHNKELQECTFKPKLNKNSLVIANKIVSEVNYY